METRFLEFKAIVQQQSSHHLQSIVYGLWSMVYMAVVYWNQMLFCRQRAHVPFILNTHHMQLDHFAVAASSTDAPEKSSLDSHVRILEALVRTTSTGCVLHVHGTAVALYGSSIPSLQVKPLSALRKLNVWKSVFPKLQIFGRVDFQCLLPASGVCKLIEKCAAIPIQDGTDPFITSLSVLGYSTSCLGAEPSSLAYCNQNEEIDPASDFTCSSWIYEIIKGLTNQTWIQTQTEIRLRCRRRFRFEMCSFMEKDV
uniref:AlNc14C8G1034 protein n=1 Tax=Albugo laibachii Nc14 TaxID=890382 RepID=F0W1V5_9STRA|nr:AlNc14C8G1034 [Albugo laibachii Nc14]|eukprot:CCA15034.1 AlNc14C8G1034 [Albugo laibachii Nc14]